MSEHSHIRHIRTINSWVSVAAFGVGAGLTAVRFIQSQLAERAADEKETGPTAYKLDQMRAVRVGLKRAAQTKWIKAPEELMPEIRSAIAELDELLEPSRAAVLMSRNPAQRANRIAARAVWSAKVEELTPALVKLRQKVTHAESIDEIMVDSQFKKLTEGLEPGGLQS